MIGTNIAREYPHHITRCKYSDKTLFMADYSEQTGQKQGVKIFEGVSPGDISCFELGNSVGLDSGYIHFDNKSFTYLDGNPRHQCECVVFPKSSDGSSWIFFVELKYGASKRNKENIGKALQQLYKTRTYYKMKGVFGKTNTCYLLVSLPLQSEPFAQSVVTPVRLMQLKRKHNIVLRLQNRAEIQNDKVINV